MTDRLTRAAVSFAIVLATYWLYALAAVPLIEPSFSAQAQQRPTASDVQQGRTITASYDKLFRRLFPPDHWAHKTPKVLETEQAMLVLKDWHRLDDGVWQLVPCALIFFPNKEQRDGHQALLLEAPRGALLQFDKDSDLSRGRVGKLLSGRIDGPITIHGDGKEEGPGDDVDMTTRDLRLTKNLIHTDAEVQFRIGPHYGSGAGLDIRLLPADELAADDSIRSNRPAVAWVELKKNVHLTLSLASAALVPLVSSPANRAGKAAAAARVAGAAAPVEVTCQGPLHFDLQERTATLADQVDVVRPRRAGAADTLACQLLTIVFEDRKLESSSARTDAWSSISPRTVVAQGDPVRCDSPATASFARCQTLKYTLATGRVQLEGGRQVALRQGPNEMRAAAVQYEPGTAPGRLPKLLWATGPGELLVVPGADPSEKFRATWARTLHLRRHDGQPVVTIEGNPELMLTGAGMLGGDRMQLYLRETPAAVAGAAATVGPDRMLVETTTAAARHVRIESPELSGRVGRLELWFAPQAAGTAAGSAAAEARPAASGGTSRRHPRQPPPADRHYQIDGKLLQVGVVQQQHHTEVASLTVDGDVYFRQAPADPPTGNGFGVRGSWLHVAGADRPDTQVTVVGSPARVEARDMAVQGGKIQLAREENRLQIPTPGSMTLPLRRDLAGNNSGGNGRLHITWQRRMDFDGQRATFTGEVVGQDQQNRLVTDVLEVRLSQPVRFERSVAADRIDLDSIAGNGPFTLARRIFTGQELVAVEHVYGSSFSVSLRTGAVKIGGPGQVTSVRRGRLRLPGQVDAEPPAEPPGAAGAPLRYLCVDFPRHAEGDLHRREISFVGHVRTVVGPVRRWDDRIDWHRAGPLAANEMLLAAQELTVRDAVTPAENRRSLELEAAGNVDVEGTDRLGRTFTAQAARIRYAQAKQLLVAEGSHWADAVVQRPDRRSRSVQKFKAGKVFYWLDSGVVNVDAARLFDLTSPSARKPAAEPREVAGPR